MGKRATICLATLGGVIGITIISLLYSQREPRYNGRSLSDWLTISFSAEVSQAEREEAATAIRQIGNKGLHLLVKRASNASPTKEKIKALVRKYPMPLIPRSVLNWAKKPPDYTRLYEARIGMMILGRAAAPVIPELTHLALTSAPRGQPGWAIEALGDIGLPSLPTLLTFMTNSTTPAALRSCAAQQFRKFGTNALVVLPNLIQYLDDTNVWFSSSCAGAIGDLALDPKTSIPALVKCLHAANADLRRNAAQGLARFGAAARVALADLKEAESLETDLATKSYLQWLLDKSEPDAPHSR